MAVVDGATMLQAGDTLIVRISADTPLTVAELIGEGLRDALAAYQVDVLLVAAEEFAVARWDDEEDE